jgi:cell division protein FtsI/penicillin-binding protein 2
LFILLQAQVTHSQSFQKALDKEFGAIDGGILLIDPNQGSIVGSVHPEIFTEQKHAPGSLIKIFTAMAAYGENRDLPVFQCPPTLSTDPNGCWNRNGHGRLTASGAIAFSCNVYFKQLARTVSLPDFVNTLIKFDLIAPQQKQALLENSDSAEDMLIGKPPYLSIYPVLLVRAYSAIQNGGYLWGFHTHNWSQPVHRVYIAEDLRRLIDRGLSMSGEQGTSSQARVVSGVAVSGKTGTSLLMSNGRIDWKKTEGWWIGFYPAVNPEIAIMTFVRNGNGSMSAAPLGGKVLKLYLEFSREHSRAALQ